MSVEMMTLLSSNFFPLYIAASNLSQYINILLVQFCLYFQVV